MAEEKKEEKRPAAHKVAVHLLNEKPLAHLETLACMYREGIVVPAKDIPELIDAFERAYEAVKRATTAYPYVLPEEEEAIQVLRNQAEEVKKKEEREELRKRIFAYLADHPDGTRLIELEEEFGLVRIQIAREVRTLIEENKAEKRGLLYFAI